jgi:hypothetical protein
MLLAAMLLLEAGLGLYLLRQVFAANKQAVQVAKAVTEYQANVVPKLQQFGLNLQAFGRVNPDFQPILAKYNLLTPIAPASSPKK